MVTATATVALTVAMGDGGDVDGDGGDGNGDGVDGDGVNGDGGSDCGYDQFQLLKPSASCLPAVPQFACGVARVSDSQSEGVARVMQTNTMHGTAFQR